MSHLLKFVPIIILLGCADNAMQGVFRDADTGAPGDSDDNNETGNESTNSQPLYWSIEGQWQVLDGQVIPETSTLEVSFWVSEVESCSYPVQIIDVADSLAQSPDENLIGWYTLQFEYPVFDESCDWTIKNADSDTDGQGALSMGMGPFDVRLEGALSAAGIAPDQSSTYGLYLADPQNPSSLLVFGVIGTEAQYSTVDAIDSTNPLPDDTYHLTALYLFPY